MIAKTHGSRLPLVTWPMVVSPRAWRSGRERADPGIEHEDGEEDEGGPRDRAGMKYSVRIPVPTRSWRACSSAAMASTPIAPSGTEMSRN